MRALLVIALLASPALADDPKGFARYPGARPLCAEHVNGGTMHITWTSYATRDALATVVAHYEKALGVKASKPDDRGARTIEVDRDRHVTIYPSSSENKLPTCSTKAYSAEKTLVMLSTAARR